MPRSRSRRRLDVGLLLALGIACDGGPTRPTATLALLGSGGFDETASLEASATRGPARVAAGDLDGDGSPDAVLAGKHIELRFDIESGKRFIEASTDRDGLGAAVADLFGDTRAEALVLSSPRSLLVLQADDGGLQVLEDVTTQEGSCAVTTADLDGDGILEVLVAGPKGLFLHRLEAGGLSPSVHQANKGPACSGPGTALTTGDLDGDGAPDVAMIIERDDLARVVMNDGFGGLGSARDFELSDPPTAVGIVDANGDGAADLVVGTTTRVQFVPQTSDGLGEETIRLADATEVLVIRDLDADGSPELVAVDEAGAQLVVWRREGTQWSFDASSITLEPSLDDVITTDADRDGRLDALVVSHGASGCG